MEKKFNESFRMDDKGLPRRWRPGDDISSKFEEARKLGYRVLDLYSIIRLNPKYQELSFLKDDPDTITDQNLIVLTEDECSMFKQRFKKETDAAYLEAMRDQENAGGISKIPMPMIVLLIILGFNEFWALITNPLLLVVFIFCSVIAYIVWFLGFADVPLQIASELVSHVLLTIKSWVVATAVRQVVGGSKAEKKD